MIGEFLFLTLLKYVCLVNQLFLRLPVFLVTKICFSAPVPPKLPTIAGYTNDSVVKVSYTEPRVNLTCIAREGKPAATFRWFRNGVELTENVIIDSIEKLNNKLENGRSVLMMSPRNEDNDALFTCQATNPAMPRPANVTVQLSVLRKYY